MKMVSSEALISTTRSVGPEIANGQRLKRLGRPAPVQVLGKIIGGSCLHASVWRKELKGEGANNSTATYKGFSVEEVEYKTAFAE